MAPVRGRKAGAADSGGAGGIRRTRELPEHGFRSGRTRPNSKTLPTAKVRSIAPSAAPTRIPVRMHGRCRIDRVFFNYNSRRRYNHRAANHDGVGKDRSRIFNNNLRRSPGSYDPP